VRATKLPGDAVSRYWRDHSIPNDESKALLCKVIDVAIEDLIPAMYPQDIVGRLNTPPGVHITLLDDKPGFGLLQIN